MRDPSEKVTRREGATDPEPTWPHPPRYWWLRRIGLTSLLLAFGLSGIRAVWGWEAKRRLDRELEPILALGEPVSGRMMDPLPVPDPENGALLYLKAMTAIGTDSPAASAMDYPGYPPFPARWHKMEDKSVATNSEVFRLVRQARGYSRFDWGLRVSTPSSSAAIPHLNKARHIANIVGDAALHAHVHGDDAEALERVRDLRHAARALEGPPHFLVNHSVSVGIQAITLYRLQVIAPDLAVAPEADDAPTPGATPPPARQPGTARPATRAQVRALIGELLDERGQLDDLRRAMVFERAASVDIAGWFGDKASLLRPMFKLDAVRLVRAGNARVAASTLPNSPAVTRALGPPPPPRTSLQLPALANRGVWRNVVWMPVPAKQSAVDYTRILSTDVVGSNAGIAIEQDIRVRMERRLTAVALAVRLYRVDHGERFPPSLEALVPQYLPQVPVDPAAPNGRPLRYLVMKGGLPDGGDRSIVYSVGTDGVDSTAEVGPVRAGLPNQPVYDYCRGVDQWRDLKRWAPPPTPAQEAEEARQELIAQPVLDALDAATRPAR